MYVPGYGYFPKAGGDIIDSVLARQAAATAAAAAARPHRPAAADAQQQHAADDGDLPPAMMMVPIGYYAGTHAAGLAPQLPAAQQVQLLPLPPGEQAFLSRCDVHTLRRHARTTLRLRVGRVCWCVSGMLRVRGCKAGVVAHRQICWLSLYAPLVCLRYCLTLTSTHTPVGSLLRRPLQGQRRRRN